MKRYHALRIITLQPVHAARVQLTPAQAFDRRHAVRVVDGEAGVYEVTASFQFKAGEEFGYDGELPHVLASEVVPVSAETAAGPAHKAPPPGAVLVRGFPGGGLFTGRKPKAAKP